MSIEIRPSDIALWAGGSALDRFGVLAWTPAGHESLSETFTRAGAAYRTTPSGVLIKSGTDVPRAEHIAGKEHWRLELSRTQRLDLPFAPATQAQSLAAGTYTLSVVGAGSCAASGATDGAYGSATEGADLTFTATALQDVTFTVTDPLDRFQCEDGEFSTSPIDGPAGTVRADEIASLPLPPSLAVPGAMTAYMRFIDRGYAATAAANARAFEIGDGVETGKLHLNAHLGASWRVEVNDGDGIFHNSDTGVVGAVGDMIEVLAVLDPATSTFTAVASVNEGVAAAGPVVSYTPAPVWDDTGPDGDVFRLMGGLAGPSAAMDLRTLLVLPTALTGTAAERLAAIRRIPGIG